LRSRDEQKQQNRPIIQGGASCSTSSRESDSITPRPLDTLLRRSKLGPILVFLEVPGFSN
jgi:hypothetical protein